MLNNSYWGGAAPLAPMGSPVGAYPGVGDLSMPPAPPGSLGQTGFSVQLPPAPQNNNWDIPTDFGGGGGPGSPGLGDSGPSLATSNPGAAASLGNALGAFGNPGLTAAAALGLHGFAGSAAGQIGNRAVSTLSNLAGLGFPVSLAQGAARLASGVINNDLNALDINPNNPNLGQLGINTDLSAPHMAPFGQMNNTVFQSLGPAAVYGSHAYGAPALSGNPYGGTTGPNAGSLSMGLAGNVNAPNAFSFSTNGGFRGGALSGISHYSGLPSSIIGPQPEITIPVPDAPTSDPTPEGPAPDTSGMTNDADASGVGGSSGAGPSGDGPSGPGPDGGDAWNRGGTIRSGDYNNLTDDVPARLTRGEIVMNPEAAHFFGPVLRHMNALGLSRRLGRMPPSPQRSP